MCLKVVERYATCGCLYHQHPIDPCAFLGRPGHRVQQREVLVGIACPRHVDCSELHVRRKPPVGDASLGESRHRRHSIEVSVVVGGAWAIADTSSEGSDSDDFVATGGEAPPDEGPVGGSMAPGDAARPPPATSDPVECCPGATRSDVIPGESSRSPPQQPCNQAAEPCEAPVLPCRTPRRGLVARAFAPCVVYKRLLAVIAMVSLSLSLWWAVWKADVSGGFTVGAYMVAVGSMVILPMQNRHNSRCAACRAP